jgi:hypothetical protein
MQIAILCASKNSIYRKIPDLNIFDANRNARTFIGTEPVICHPPCRGWSAFMSHYAKPPPGEKDLAYFCTEKIAINGGVLEHPAYSKYLSHFKNSPHWKILTVHQSWFGYPITKKTWLLMPKHYQIPEIPFDLTSPYPPGYQKRIFENMSHKNRSHTTISFAQWLIHLVQINKYQLSINT